MFARAAAVITVAALLVGQASPAGAAPTQERQWAQLQRELNGVVADAAANGITLSVALTDLSGRYCDATLQAGGNERDVAASVIKLGLITMLMDKVDDGQLSLDTMVHIPAGSDNIVGGTGTLRLRQFPLDISIDELMHLMIQISDNSAANVLIDVAGGFDPVNAYFQAHGFTTLWLGRKLIHPSVPPLQENYLTAGDIDRLLVDLWQGTIVSRKSSDYIINLMRGQTVDTKYGAVIPREYLANKTGELANAQHDSGFITLPGRELAMVTTTMYSGLSAGFVDTFVQDTARDAYQFAQQSLPGDDGRRPSVSYCTGKPQG